MIIILCQAGWVWSHYGHNKFVQNVLSSSPEEYSSKFGPQTDLPFSGPLSFAHLPYARCLDDKSTLFDIAIIGFPFDTAVTYRPGARFGPWGIRSGSRRLRYKAGYSLAWESSPYDSNTTKVVDCGDVSTLLRPCSCFIRVFPPLRIFLQVPVIPFDNKLAVEQMEVAYSTLLNREVATTCDHSLKSSCMTAALAKDGKLHPRVSYTHTLSISSLIDPRKLVTLGGDHAIVSQLIDARHQNPRFTSDIFAGFARAAGAT